MKSPKYLPIGILAIAIVQSSFAAVITGPTLVTGPNAIDPLARVVETLTPTNVTSQSVIENTDGFGTVQTFTGFGNGTNIIDFSAGKPDVKFSFSGDTSPTTGSNLANPNFATSGSNSVRFESTANTSATAKTFTATMTFGDWDGTSFTDAASGSLVAPNTVAFTFAGLGSRMHMLATITATFKGLSGETLSTQTLTDLAIVNNSSVSAGYFGYQGEQVGSVGLTFTTKASIFSATPTVGIDDFGFGTTTSPIPEPSSYALLAGGLMLGMTLVRRRRAGSASVQA
ncbi:MAG: PEP-CTERM sorting domain-containing protein [Opitutus sp.]|nr:PEP-CTERM sorting domain-containing protein [Opitutus sp.]MCS6247468.1 PEP-CTERM sorting domain-containing protein [Opitutus sp.]MCS6274140.1 PEP-CTERM sorting domain-containing protein [Opitutus sp.]MCS6277049.1 PEP-CTERM sorting domain-containing protein [Opitutus sp.]MCS6300171.1 PEP-CTERM sorting domain-containing protein [Opitutus sp.]